MDIAVVRSQKRRRSIQLRAIGNNTVELRVPLKLPSIQVLKIVTDHLKFLIKAKDSKAISSNALIKSGQIINIFGKEHVLELTKSSDIDYFIDDLQKKISIKSSNESISRKTLYSKTSSLLKDYIELKTVRYAQQMGLKFGKIRLKYVRSLWGSCSHAGNLTFNKRLVHYPPEIIDYVIVHELGHLVHRNHRPIFWNYVEKYYPQYKEARAILKKSLYG